MTAVKELERLSGKLFIDGDFSDSAATDGFDGLCQTNAS